MGNGAALVKVLALLGLIIVLTAAITGNTPAEWNVVRNTLSTGIVWPSFWNPFSQDTVRRTAYADYPVSEYDLFSEGTLFWSGCADDAFNRSRCLGEQDGDGSYVQLNATDATPSGIWGASFNYSNPSFRDVQEADLRSVTITIQCTTVSEGTSVFAFQASYLEGGILALTGFCPKDRYENVVLHRDFPVGTTDPDNPFSGNPQAFILGGFIPDLDTGTGFNRGLVQARFSYFRIDIEAVVTGASCEAPEGAWFPFFDNVACSIGMFATGVWKGIQFVASAIAYVGLALSALIGFVGTIIVNVLLGVVAVLGSIFALGAPSPAQEIMDVVVIVLGGFVVFVIVSMVRGTEG